jgi:hypothetical protein
MTYADSCLEIAGKATPGPWGDDDGHVMTGDGFGFSSTPAQYYIGDEYGSTGDSDADAEFIATSREMVPELCRRLQLACEALRAVKSYIIPGDFVMLAEELEAMPRLDKE